MIGTPGTSAGRCARIALGAIAFAAASGARAGEAAEPPPDPGAKPPKVLCDVKITDTDGLPLAQMGLVAFEKGVYRLRTESGREIEVPEKEVSSVEFMPVGKPRPEKHEPPEPEGRRPPKEGPASDGGWRPRGPAGADNPLAWRAKEERDKLVRMKLSGLLAAEIAALEKRLRKVPTALEAAGLLRRIVAAKSVADGTSPSEEDIRALADTIEKPDVRERMRHIPAKYFLPQFGGPRGPPRR